MPELFSSSPAADGRSEFRASGERATRLASKIIKTFNTWRFKREQPSDSDALFRCVSLSVLEGEPVPFVLYWGKGRRDDVALPDLKCLDYLQSFKARLDESYTFGARIVVLLTDSHAKLNGHSKEARSRYYSGIIKEAEHRGFETRLLSDVVDQHPAPVPLLERSDINPALFEKLRNAAAKWHAGGLSPEDAALVYYRINMGERVSVGKAYAKSVFITFNSSDYRDLFPTEMPIFYMYSLKKGSRLKPWFVDQ